MENFATSAATAIPPSANEIGIEAPAPRAERELRSQRILQLRELIEAGQYCVSAAHLADAILRAARQAN